MDSIKQKIAVLQGLNWRLISRVTVAVVLAVLLVWVCISTSNTSDMQEKYAAKLKACAEQGFTFERAGFKGSYYDEEWHISYGMKVTHEGNSVPTDIACEVTDGKINIFSIGWPQEFPESDIVGEALFAHYVD